MKRGKNYLESEKKVDRSKLCSVREAVESVRLMAYAKFDETLDISVGLNLKKNVTIRENFIMPHRFMADRRILVFAKGKKAEEATEAGATYVGSDDYVKKIEEGWLEFDVCIATPDMMRDIGRLGRFLGRRGLMPTPRAGTVTQDVVSVVKELQSGRVEIHADKGAVVHMSVGKLSMKTDQIVENIDKVISEIFRKKPVDCKGDFLKSVYISSVMGPSVQLDRGLYLL